MVSDAEKRRVGALIRARRQELGLRQHQFADRVGVSRNTASSWETGRAYPERYAGKVEAVLRISLSDVPGESYPDPDEARIWSWTEYEPHERRAMISALRETRSGRAG